MSSNDTGLDGRGPALGLSDAHGRAALVLVESLIHILKERSILTNEDALEIVATGLEVQSDAAEAADGAGQPIWQSHTLLAAIAESLKFDSENVDAHRL